MTLVYLRKRIEDLEKIILAQKVNLDHFRKAYRCKRDALKEANAAVDRLRDQIADLLYACERLRNELAEGAVSIGAEEDLLEAIEKTKGRK